MPEESPSPEEVTAVQEAHQLWSQGAHPTVTERIRPFADQERPWALALMSWITMQQGMPVLEQSFGYARAAASHGMPWVAGQVFNHAIGQIPNAPQILAPTLEMGRLAAPWSSGIDPVGQGWNLAAQGHAESGIKLMGMTLASPFFPDQWDAVIEGANARVLELDGLIQSARSARGNLDDLTQSGINAIEKSKSDIETAARQAGLLVTTVTSDATNSLYKSDAQRNADESKVSWVTGLVVLGVAALLAVLPILLHYAGRGPTYSSASLLGAHLASTAALGTFAGVLLARGRSRDIAAQRSHDLSTAMGTMIGYSNQISNPEEKERFMMTMGQLVLQAHLSGGVATASGDESLSGAVALANLLRSPTPKSQEVT